MITKLQRAFASLNRKKADGERGFSLIELIIVIVILGILVAIAIPIYNNIQDTAKKNAIATAAANGASQAVSDLADDDSTTAADLNTNLAKLQKGDVVYVALATTASPVTTDNVCVLASDKAGAANAAASSKAAWSGPGCGALGH